MVVITVFKSRVVFTSLRVVCVHCLSIPVVGMDTAAAAANTWHNKLHYT